MIIKHSKYQIFQKEYGFIPKSDKNNLHIIKSRMLQGVYRNSKFETVYCNTISEKESFTNFMKNEKLEIEAKNEFESIKKRQRLTDENRLLSNLLSSQPMAFNLFLPLKWDNYILATKVFSHLFPRLNINKILTIQLEYIPGDENGKKNRFFQIDNSCFDVFIEYADFQEEKKGVGIEVKYTESFSKTNFNNLSNIKKKKYEDAIIKHKKQFDKEYTKIYLSSTFNQLFRNQLIVEELSSDKKLECIQLVLHSVQDEKCKNTIVEFHKMLQIKDKFNSLTIEKLIETILIQPEIDDELKNLYKSIYERYCNYSKIEKYFI